MLFTSPDIYDGRKVEALCSEVETPWPIPEGQGGVEWIRGEAGNVLPRIWRAFLRGLWDCLHKSHRDIDQIHQIVRDSHSVNSKRHHSTTMVPGERDGRDTFLGDSALYSGFTASPPSQPYRG